MATNPLTPKCLIPREQLLAALESAPAIARAAFLYLRDRLPAETTDDVFGTLTINALAESLTQCVSAGAGLSAAQYKAFRHDLMQVLGKHSNGAARVEVITNEAGN